MARLTRDAEIEIIRASQRMVTLVLKAVKTSDLNIVASASEMFADEMVCIIKAALGEAEPIKRARKSSETRRGYLGKDGGDESTGRLG